MLRLLLPMMALFALVGCGGPKTTPTTKPDSPTLPTVPATIANSQESQTAVKNAATEFLKAAQEGKATPAMLTAEFKKVLAPSPGNLSELVVGSWLLRIGPKASASAVSCPFATAEYGFASAVAPEGRILLRLVKAGNSWLVDWCQVTTSSLLIPINLSGSDAGLISSGFAVASFLETVGQGQPFDHAEAFLTPTACVKLGPNFPVDEKLGFNRSRLHSALGSMVPSNTSCTFVSNKPFEGGYRAVVKLKANGVEKEATLKLVKGSRPGVWLVDDFEAK